MSQNGRAVLITTRRNAADTFYWLGDCTGKTRERSRPGDETRMPNQNRSLQGKAIAILATDGVEQSELEEPRDAFDAAGATTRLVSLRAGAIQGFSHGEKSKRFHVDLTLSDARASDFDALLLPGGVANPDALRVEPQVVELVRDFATAGKPIAAICHGAWSLVEADLVRGRTLTSWPSLKTDLKNAGAIWVDREVVVDRGLVTSQKPADLPAFIAKAIEEISEGRHESHAVASQR
jgi:protease I